MEGAGGQEDLLLEGPPQAGAAVHVRRGAAAVVCAPHAGAPAAAAGAPTRRGDPGAQLVLKCSLRATISQG